MPKQTTLLTFLRRFCPAPFWLAALIALAGLTGAPQPALASPPQARSCLDQFLVRPGDSLTGIANLYGFDWRVLAELNHLKPPYDLLAGQWLCLPAVVGAEAAAAALPPNRQPRVEARVRGAWLELHVFNYPPQKTYTVRAAQAEIANIAVNRGVFNKLGLLRTRKGGELRVRYPLPKRYQGQDHLMVCLKDMSSNALTCFDAYAG